ncbi:5'-nucleotidase C-terminal domain-containing protein [soil metagenome]
MKKILFLGIVTLTVVASCTPVKNATSNVDDGLITINFIQINDVYEIAPLSGGKEGGMARVATLKKKYLDKNPNTFLLMAGDFLSPSVYNSLKYEGKNIRGRQMIDAMNSAGIDIAIFGNHEFDIKESELQERINESHFQWISSNTFHKQNGSAIPFTKVGDSGSTAFPTSYIKTITDADGTRARVGFIAVTLPFNKANYVSYTDAFAAAKEVYNQLKDSVDAVIAITHQTMEEDKQLAKEIPGLAMIVGGHEHDQHSVKIGNVGITKAMANAKSAYVLRLIIDKESHTVKVRSLLEKIDSSVAVDSETNAVVQRWVKIADDSYSSLGFNAKKTVIETGEPLDGRETSVRAGATNLTKLIVSAMAYSAPKADVLIMNGGSIRVDDILQMPVTQYDIIRTLPFGGGIREVDLKGSMLLKIFKAGLKNKGTGGYLHYNSSVVFDAAADKWKLNNVEIDNLKTYRVAMPEFLLTGGEANLDFLTSKNTEIVKVYDAETSAADPRSDIRRAIIQYAGKK